MYPTRYLYLRDRRHWEASITGLIADEDGVLTLARVPAPATPVSLPGPWEVEPSGLAAAACCGLFVSDAEHALVRYRDGLCATEAVLPAATGCAPPTFVLPLGLALDRHWLALADGVQGRVLLFAATDLRPVRTLSGFVEPVAVALDAVGWLYVLDRGARRVRRFLPRGAEDIAYGNALGKHLVRPVALALDAEGALLVADADSESVLRFDVRGVPDAAAFALLPGWKPRALAVRGTRAYIADAADGSIRVFDAGVAIGIVPDFRGPVAALAVSDDGSLHIKAGSGGEVIVACAGRGLVARGELLAGPFDAGERDGWERAALQVTTPPGAGTTFELFFDESELPPAANDWMPARCDDLLLVNVWPSPLPPPQPAMRRFLWLRVRLQAGSATESPRLAQVFAATADEDYRRYLPSIYAEQDDDATLEHLLGLMRSEIGDGEARLGALPQALSPAFAPAASLPWLAAWLGFELPQGLAIDQRREVLARVWALYRHRGTLTGLIEFIHLYTGVKAQVLEWYRERKLWQLDTSAALGFDTRLPPAAADGLSVADPAILRDSEPAWGCAVPDRVVAGHAVVGADRPLAKADIGSLLFDDEAHRITVLVPAGRAPDEATRQRVRDVVAAEAPAHVLCEVCFVEPLLRIGLQARIGIDTVIGSGATPLRLDEIRLGEGARLEGRAGAGAGIGQDARIGRNLVLA
ncbi:MAG: hypothetical protein JNN30_08815 [Rhodanobacteraceae bacterium]|nr:hypothetical protein [Rhodanobacteraceae bacterium]